MRLNEDVREIIVSYCKLTNDSGGCIVHHAKTEDIDNIEPPKNFIVIPEENLKNVEYRKIWLRVCDCVIFGFQGNNLFIQLYQDRDLFEFIVKDIEKQCNIKILNQDT